MDSFFAAVAANTDSSEECKQDLSACLKEISLPKGEILVKPVTTCNYLFLLSTALPVPTTYLKDGKEITDWISDEHTFACSIISYINPQPDRRGIDTIKNSVLYSLHYNALDALCQKHHTIETFTENY